MQWARYFPKARISSFTNHMESHMESSTRGKWIWKRLRIANIITVCIMRSVIEQMEKPSCYVCKHSSGNPNHVMMITMFLIGFLDAEYHDRGDAMLIVCKRWEQENVSTVFDRVTTELISMEIWNKTCECWPGWNILCRETSSIVYNCYSESFREKWASLWRSLHGIAVHVYQAPNHYFYYGTFFCKTVQKSLSFSIKLRS